MSLLKVYDQKDPKTALIETHLLLEIQALLQGLGVLVDNFDYEASGNPDVEGLTQDLTDKEQFILDVNYPNYSRLRSKYLSEHSLAQPEAYWVISGQYLMSVHAEGKVFQLRLGVGDFIKIPSGLLFWMDFGQEPNLIAIKYANAFDSAVVQYTGSKIADMFSLLE